MSHPQIRDQPSGCKVCSHRPSCCTRIFLNPFLDATYYYPILTIGVKDAACPRKGTESHLPS